MNTFNLKLASLTSITKKLSTTFPIDALLTIYKSNIRPYSEYLDVIYHKPHNDSFSQKIENVNRACLGITGALEGISWDKLYQDLGLESFSDRRWLIITPGYHIKIIVELCRMVNYEVIYIASLGKNKTKQRL